MTQPALVTCGVTAFNAADTIERAINSALSQTWPALEIVVVDDGSTDATPEILAGLAQTDPRIRVLRLRCNGGAARARNRILTEARGEFVAFFDDDDESHPDRVRLQLLRLTEYERDFAAGAAVICHTARQVVYPDGIERLENTMGEIKGRAAPSGLPVAHRILMGTPLDNAYGACPTCSQFARLSTYREIGGFDPGLRRSEDTDFNIRLAIGGGHFVGIAQPLVTQFMTPTSDKSLDAEFDCHTRILAKHRHLLDAERQYDFCRGWMQARNFWLRGLRLNFVSSMLSLGITHPVLFSRRLWQARRHMALNLAFRRFHRVGRPA